MAQQSKLLGRDGVKKICVVCLVGASMSSFEGSLAWMLYWSNVLFLLDTLKPCYLQTLSIIKASAKSTVLQKSPSRRSKSCKSPSRRSKSVSQHHAISWPDVTYHTSLSSFSARKCKLIWGSSGSIFPFSSARLYTANPARNNRSSQSSPCRRFRTCAPLCCLRFSRSPGRRSRTGAKCAAQSPCRGSQAWAAFPVPWRCCSSRTMQGWGKRIHRIWAPWQCRHPWAKKRPWVAWGKTRKNSYGRT